MVLLTPTSISYTGTSATIGANGSVEFTACTSLSLNGAFSADYDNYVVVVKTTVTSRGWLNFKLRDGGVDSSTDYNYQRLSASATSVTAGRATSLTLGYLMVVDTDGSRNNGVVANFYGPYLNQPTAIRSITAGVDVGAEISDFAHTHGVSNEYDGLTLIPQNGTITGLVSVYGLVGS